MPTPLQSMFSLFLLPLIACATPPSSTTPSPDKVPAVPEKRDEQATSGAKAADQGKPDAQSKDDATQVAALVEAVTSDLVKSSCTSPPKLECETVKAFASAGVPERPKSPSFTVGTVVGQRDRFMILRFEPNGAGLPRVAASVLTTENATEVAQSYAYIASIQQGKRDLSSPLHAFLDHVSPQEQPVSAKEVARGYLLEPPDERGPWGGLQLVRQKGRQLYVLWLHISSSATDFDLHPTVDLAVFPAP